VTNTPNRIKLKFSLYHSNKVRDVISGLKKKPAIVAFFANPDEGKIRIAESIKRACLKTGLFLS
jgi:pyridoxine 5'-phosphate synthase PdxJ